MRMISRHCLAVLVTATLLSGVSLRAAEERNLVVNGSFEFWDSFGKEGLEQKKQYLWTDNPELPQRWSIGVSRPSSMKQAQDCHGGTSAVAFSVPKNCAAGLEMYLIEVMPKAAYSFGFWVKGKGKATLTINGLAVEGRQKLAFVEGAAGETWSEARGSFVAPGHTRTVSMSLSVSGESELVIDDVFLSIPLEKQYDADAVLGKKYGKDEHTLLFEDFDGETVSFIPTCKEVAVTDEKGGRFGKGLRLDHRGAATIPLALGEMPEEGTVEFWISPDSGEGMNYMGLMGAKGILEFASWVRGMIVWVDYGEFRESLGVIGNSEIDVLRMKKGQWHHVAYTWDKKTVRYYINGVLIDIKTTEALKWPDKVSFIQLSHPMERNRKIDGTIDEIRISNIRRYGPAVPGGMAYTPPIIVKSMVGDSQKASEVSKPPPPKEKIAEERKKMIGSVAPTGNGEFEDKPNPDTDYIYEATSAKPLVKGGLCEIEKDKIVKGLAVVRSGHACGNIPDGMTNAGIYWTLKNIKKGSYWLGVLYNSDRGAVSTYGPLTVYLNGRIVQLASQSNPVQLAPGVWFAEVFAEKAEELSSGDEIAVAFRSGAPAARLILHSKMPEPASECPWKYPSNFNGHQWNLYTALGVNAEGKFRYKDGKPVQNIQYSSIEQVAPSIATIKDDAGKVNFSAYIANPLPIPVTVRYQCVIKSFYGDTVAKDVKTLTVQPHDQIERKIAFDWKEGELTHFADITLLKNDPPDLSASREDGGLGWPKYEKLTFFPGQRQILPWPDPFNCRVVRRITIAEPFGGARQAYVLDGNDWEFGYTPELEPPMPVPADIKFEQRARVPKGWHWPPLDSFTPRPHGVYYRKSIDLPDDIAGRSFKLVVDSVNCEATAYVNNRKCGNVRGENTPLVCDITKALKPGKNEIVIVIRDAIAIMDQDYVNKKSPVVNLSYLDAPGIFGANGFGIGSVKIQSAPSVSSEDVFIATSVRNKHIAAKITAANRGTADANVKISAEVLDDGNSVLNLGEKEFTLKPDQPFEFSLEKSWKNPVLWEPGTPHLYSMNVTIADAKTGNVIDLRRDRFGFRESWIDGGNIMFNGYPIKPPGYHFLFRLNPRGNFIFTRCAGPDWFDEIGIIGYWSTTGIANTPSQHNVESDKFWKTAEANNIAALKVKQNSPHIIAWDISNEWLCFFWGDAMRGARRFKALSDAVRAYDPTRWTLANAEGDLHGLLDNYSFHYMNHYFGPPNEYTMNGRTPYSPDSAFWRSLDRQFKPGEETRYCPLYPVMLNPDKKVIMDNEFLWKSGGIYMPPGPTRVVGEDDVISPAVDSSSGPIAWMWKTEIDGHRDLGVSMTGVYSHHPGVIRGAYLEQALIIPENQHHGYAGAKETRRFTLVNGLFRPCKMTFRWSLADRSGKPVAEGKEVRKMISGDIQRGEFSFELPKVSAKSLFTLKAQLESNGPSTGSASSPQAGSGQGKFVCGEEWDIEVFPAKAPVTGVLARHVLLYDTKGVTAKALAAMGVKFKKIDSFASPIDNPSGTTLIIGEDALNQFSSGITAPLAKFVELGGRVVVLAQEATPANLPVETFLEPRKWSSQVFVRAGSHPIVEGLNSYDLHFWQPDRSVGTGAYKKPFSGSFITIIDTSFWGYWDNMNWTQMMEVFRGKGSYILCQLPVASRHDVEPMAAELLARIIKYSCGKDAYACPVKTLSAVTGPASETAEILQKFQVNHRIAGVDSDVDANSPVLLDADFARSTSPEQKAKWTEKLKNGAHVLVVNAEPQDNEWISQLAGSRVTLAVPPYEIWDGRGFRKGWSKYTAGLSHLDLYWKRYGQDEKAGSQAEETTNVIEPFQHYSASAEKGRELVFPGALVEIPSGRGLLLLDQRRWAAKDEGLAKLAMRNVSSLMTALDVGMASFMEPRELPNELAHRSLDLAPLANYALQAAAAGSAKGKDADRNIPIDLRAFPKGKQSFLNIPFVLADGPVSGMALASGLDPATARLPGESVIPVGFLAEGFYFLHTAAKAGDGLAANYRIVYEDGSTFDVPVQGSVNIADWNAIKVLPGASIVWTGSTDEFPMTGVYRMLWVNPKPETPVKEIVFSNPEKKAFPVLIGVTAAARRETIPVPPEVATRAKKALEDGRTAFQNNKIDDARRLLRDAVVLDPSLREAYPALADAAERKGDEDGIFDAYRLWTISGPRQPLPWNRIGEILEKRKDTRGALDAYKRSLRIEWNQPPIMEAVKRLEAAKAK